MKLKINQSRLREGIKIVEKTSSRSTSLPILKNIMIKAEKNIINISATDLEVSVQWWSLAKIEEEGEVVVPVSILSGLINFLPDKIITLSFLGDNLEIECGDYKTKIKGFTSDDFPIIPKISEKNSVIVNLLDFLKSLNQVVDIPSFSITRPEISGILFNFTDNKLEIVATDSYRLGEKKIELNMAIEENFSFIIPQKAAKEIISIFGDKQGEIKILSGANQILFELLMTEIHHPKIHFTSRQVEGEYPNYKEIIPKENKIKAILNRSDLINQIKAAGLFSNKVGEIIFKIEPDKKRIEISSQNPESGNYTSFIYGKIKGKKDKISFNYRYLIDGLSKISDSEIIFEINGSGDPGVFRPLKDNSFLYIVMPIKI